MDMFTYHDVLAHLGVGGAHPGGLALTKELLKDLPIKQTSHILDAGCGTGQTAAFLAKTYGCQVTALDQHPLMVERARERFAREKVTIQLVEGDMENSTLAKESFDFIIAESVTVFTNVTKTAREYIRLLRKGGMLLDLEMTAGAAFSADEVGDFQELYGLREIPIAEDWRSIFRNAGFHSVEIVKEHTVAHLLEGQSLQKDAFELQELNPLEPLDPSLYQIWDKHQRLTERFSNQLKYVVYKAEK
ncbi:methyltransferase domain-containing protein [Virgibacillus dakarensis]|nr:methyltransferase domain-containing protein [Virgibacillus dakarensis]